MSMSSSRGFGSGETSYASETSSSVCWPIAETTATTRVPDRLASTSREATRRIFSGSATEVPPNFMTRVPAPAGGSAGSTAGTGSKVVSLMVLSVLHRAATGESPAERDLVCVLEVAADRKAACEPSHAGALAQAVGQVGGCRLAGHVRVRREDDLLDAVSVHPLQELVDAEVRGLDAVERRERTAEHVVDATELVRALDGEEVGGLLNDADDGAIAPGIGADGAELLLRQGPALAAEADALLDLADRVGKGEGLLVRDAEDVEREALRRARAHPGQARQLRDQIVDERAEHARILPTGPAGPVP